MGSFDPNVGSMEAENRADEDGGGGAVDNMDGCDVGRE
jgi:hypothetical protein